MLVSSKMQHKSYDIHLWITCKIKTIIQVLPNLKPSKCKCLGAYLRNYGTYIYWEYWVFPLFSPWDFYVKAIGPSTLVAQGPIKLALWFPCFFVCLIIYLFNWRFFSETTAPIFLIFFMMIDISEGKKVTEPDFWKRYFKGSKLGKNAFSGLFVTQNWLNLWWQLETKSFTANSL